MNESTNSSMPLTQPDSTCNISEAMGQLVAMQETLGSLGFTLTPEQVYYKDYGSQDGGSYRLMPVFDTGIESLKNFKIVGFKVISVKTVDVIDGMAQIAKMPVECIEDASVILARANGHNRSMTKNFIITAQCAKCFKTVSSYTHRDGVSTCISCL